jgi:hypothetical protein
MPACILIVLIHRPFPSSHLDSVPFGPGINDNGSGSSLNLELALQLHRRGTRVENQVGKACAFGLL